MNQQSFLLRTSRITCLMNNLLENTCCVRTQCLPLHRQKEKRLFKKVNGLGFLVI